MTISQLALVSTSLAESDANVLVVGVAGADPVVVGHDTEELNALALRIAASTAADALTVVPAPDGFASDLVAFVGLSSSEPDRDELRDAAGSAIRQLAGRGSVSLALPVHTDLELDAVVTGAAIGSYNFADYKSRTSSESEAVVEAVTIVTDIEDGDDVVQRALIVAGGVHLVRDLVNTPPVDLTPQDFAAEVLEDAESAELEVEIWDEDALSHSGFGGILGVGSGSSNPPRLIRIGYSPEGAETHLALVGKGITFDSGGLSLKPAASMTTMKSDMAGAASVYATVLVAARLHLPIAVTAWLPLAENMVSSTSYRVDDVLEMYDGTTVEITNTDAEGRLVLADAIARASAEHPDFIVDVATLTGAQIMALGYRYSGLLGNDPAFVASVADAAADAGELVWPMPIPAEVKDHLKSSIADLRNADIGDRSAGMLVAARFLQEFVGSDAETDHEISWAHLDIAGPSFNPRSPYGFVHKGGTGAIVRTLVQLAANLADA